MCAALFIWAVFCFSHSSVVLSPPDVSLPLLSSPLRQILGEFLASVDRAHVNLCKFPHETDEVYACRLLRARKFEAEKSQAMLDKSVAWRQEEKVEELRLSDEADCLTTCTPDEMQAYYQHTWIPDTYDKDGRPVWVEKTGSVRRA